jgi:hypothetical protein
LTFESPETTVDALQFRTVRIWNITMPDREQIMTTETVKVELVATLPRTMAQPLGMLAGQFSILGELEDGTGCLGGSMPSALRTLAQELREDKLSRDRARYTFTGCAGYLQQSLGSMLWKDFQKGANIALRWRFAPNEAILKCLDQMSATILELANLIPTIEHGQLEPAVHHLKEASKRFGEFRGKPDLVTLHQAMGKLSVAFSELSMAV